MAKSLKKQRTTEAAAAAAASSSSSSSAAARPAVPLISTFNTDVCNIIWSFLTNEYRTASKVCLEWRNLSRLHISKVSLMNDGLESLADVVQRGWVNVTHMDARDSDLFNDAALRTLSADTVASLPQLTSIDCSGCQRISSIGVRALVKLFGDQLKSFSQDTTPHHGLCKQMRVTKSIIAAIASADNLQALSVTLPTKIRTDDLNCLSGHKRLKSLTIFFEGFGHVLLPARLPALTELKMKTGSWNAFDWRTVIDVGYPELTRLTIDDKSCDSLQSEGWGGWSLTSALLIDYFAKFEKLKDVRIVSLSKKSSFYLLTSNLITGTNSGGGGGGGGGAGGLHTFNADETVRVSAYLNGRGITSDFPDGWPAAL